MGEIRCGDDHERSAERRRRRRAQREAEGDEATDEKHRSRQLDGRIDRADPRPAAPAAATEDRVASSGTLSYQAIGVEQAPQAERGCRSDRRSGSRAATTLRKLPTARPGSSANAPSVTAIYLMRTDGRPRRSGGRRRRARRQQDPGSCIGSRVVGAAPLGESLVARQGQRDRGRTRVDHDKPAAGCWSATVLPAYPRTGPETRHAKPPSWRMPLAKT